MSYINILKTILRKGYNMMIFDEEYYIAQIFLALNIAIIMSLILSSIFGKKTAIESKNTISNRNTNKDNYQDSNTSINKRIKALELTLQEILQILKSTPTEDKKIASTLQETTLYLQKTSDKLKRKFEKEEIVVKEELKKLQTKNNKKDSKESNIQLTKEKNCIGITIITEPNQKIHLNIHFSSEEGLCYPRPNESRIDENNKISTNQARIQDLEQNYLFYKDSDI